MSTINKSSTSKDVSNDDSIFSNALFSDLKLSSELKESLSRNGFIKMTKVQDQTISHLMDKRDVVASARTGSGKTLAFLVPAIQQLLDANFTPDMGTGALILAPTRELAMQIFVVASSLMEDLPISHGLIMGGANKTTEAANITKGLNLIIATPGRLLDHLMNTVNFNVSNLKMLIVDEADRCLEVGFEKEMHAIMNRIPKERQTLLFSATQSEKIDNLIEVSVKDPVYVGVDDHREISTATNLEQGYIVCPSDLRFRVLYAFLKRNTNKKVIVFMSSCCSVKFHATFFNHAGLTVMALHGQQNQTKRTKAFNDFSEASSGILFCTDVASRGLDIPNVDWIIQYDPTGDPKEYIHRVGRACRGDSGHAGKALMFLLPEELEFLNYLREAKVPVNEFQFPKNKIPDIQEFYEKTVSSHFSLSKDATSAFKSYVTAYTMLNMKHVFNAQNLDLKKVASSFGLKTVPLVSALAKTNKSVQKKRK